MAYDEIPEDIRLLIIPGLWAALSVICSSRPRDGIRVNGSIPVPYVSIPINFGSALISLASIVNIPPQSELFKQGWYVAMQNVLLFSIFGIGSQILEVDLSQCVCRVRNEFIESRVQANCGTNTFSTVIWPRSRFNALSSCLGVIPHNSCDINNIYMVGMDKFFEFNQFQFELCDAMEASLTQSQLTQMLSSLLFNGKRLYVSNIDGGISPDNLLLNMSVIQTGPYTSGAIIAVNSQAPRSYSLMGGNPNYPCLTEFDHLIPACLDIINQITTHQHGHHIVIIQHGLYGGFSLPCSWEKSALKIINSLPPNDYPLFVACLRSFGAFAFLSFIYVYRRVPNALFSAIRSMTPVNGEISVYDAFKIASDWGLRFMGVCLTQDSLSENTVRSALVRLRKLFNHETVLLEMERSEVPCYTLLPVNLHRFDSIIDRAGYDHNVIESVYTGIISIKGVSLYSLALFTIQLVNSLEIYMRERRDNPLCPQYINEMDLRSKCHNYWVSSQYDVTTPMNYCTWLKSQVNASIDNPHLLEAGVFDCTNNEYIRLLYTSLALTLRHNISHGSSDPAMLTAFCRSINSTSDAIRYIDDPSHLFSKLSI